MNYTKVDLFGGKRSKGTFDDFFSKEKYSSMEEAWDANDYVTCDFVKDENNILYIEARHVKNPERRLYHQLMWQNPFAGLDTRDDHCGCELADKLLEEHL